MMNTRVLIIEQAIRRHKVELEEEQTICKMPNYAACIAAPCARKRARTPPGNLRRIRLHSAFGIESAVRPRSYRGFSVRHDPCCAWACPTVRPNSSVSSDVVLMISTQDAQPTSRFLVETHWRVVGFLVFIRLSQDLELADMPQKRR